MNWNLWLPIIIGSVTAYVAVRWIYFKILKVAFEKRLVDNPEARKLQKRPVPVVGGLAVFFGVLVGVLAAAAYHNTFAPDEYSTSLLPVLCAMSVMLYTGALDDNIGLTPKSRFVIEIAAILGLVFGSGMCIDTFRGLWGIEEFSWWVAVPLTVFAGVGIINSINMIDGVNGLSSGLCIMCCVLFGLAFIWAGDTGNAVLAFSMSAALLPFFFHNVLGSKSRMFIGDAGTMVMGLLMVWFIMCLLSKSSPVAYYSAAKGVNLIAMSLAILSVPVFDTLRVMVMRVIKGRSPFSPDKTHLHHVFVNVGISHFITAMSELLIVLVITIIWGVSVLLRVSLEVQLYVVIAADVVFVWGTYAILSYHAHNHTEFLHWITHFSVRTHLGRTDWWKSITRWLDAPGDYTALMELSANPDSIECHLNSLDVNNFKERDRKLILEYMKGKAEVHVDDVIAYSGAEKVRVYPVLFEEEQAGYVQVLKRSGLGTPLIVALSNELN